MASVRFNLKRSGSRRTAIIAIARHKGIKAKFATGISIEPSNWQNRQQRAHIPGQPALTHAINQRLTALRDKILTYIIEGNQLPSPTSLVDHPQNPTPIHQLTHAHGQQLAATGCSPNTAKTYTTLSNNLLRFAGSVLVQQIDTDWLEKFNKWLYKQNYSDAHINKSLKTLKTILRHHAPHLTHVIHPPTARHRDEIYLTAREIQQLHHLDNLPAHLHRARNQLLLACYTGQRYSDLAQIRAERITEGILHITQQKTGVSVEIPVSAELQNIIEQRTPLYATNQQLNRHIKTVCQHAGIAQKVEITIYKAGRTHVKQFSKWQLVTSHTGRRSFATNALLADIPPHIVMKFTGHRTEKEFWRYVRASGREIAEKFRSHPFFTGKQ